MTDDPLRSQADYLDAIAAAIRRVDARLDAVTRTDLEARLGVGGPVHTGLGPVPSSLLGQSSPSVSLGNTQPIIGQTNLLRNPLFDGATDVFLGTTPFALVTPNWCAHYVLNSGTAPAIIEFGLEYARGIPNNNPLNSAFGLLQCRATTNTYDLDAYLYPSFSFVPNSATLPYLVASSRLSLDGAHLGSAFSVAEVRMEIVKNSTVVATSDWLDLTDSGPIAFTSDIRQLVASYYASPFPVDSYYWRLRFHVVKTGAANNSAYVLVGEPLLHFAYTPDPVPFAPLLGSWVADELLYQIGAETSARFQVQIGELTWGPGTAAKDVKLSRTGTAEMTLGGVSATALARLKHRGPLFIQGPNAMDLAITYGAFGPTNVSRDDESVGVSSSVISYDGTGKVTSVVTSRFGKTITTTPTYTGANITAVHRAVT